MAREKEFSTPFQLDLFARYVDRETPVLEVGCGYGRVLEELHRAGFRSLVGLDFSKKMIDRGRKLFPHLDLRRSEGDGLPFPEGTFQAVILVAVLTCIADSQAQVDLVSEAVRVLRDGGVLFLSDFMINEDPRNIRRYEEYWDKYGVYGVFELPGGGVLRHHTRDHILGLTEALQPLVFERAVYTTMNGNRSKGFYYLGRKGLGQAPLTPGG